MREYCSRECNKIARASDAKKYFADYHIANREKKNAVAREWKEKNKDRLPQLSKQYRERFRDKVFLVNRKFTHKKYGISQDIFDAMFESQRGLCAICNLPETKLIRGELVTMSIDHDHNTGKVRGLLCAKCNTGLGQFKDNIDNMRNAVKYLERWS